MRREPIAPVQAPPPAPSDPWLLELAPIVRWPDAPPPPARKGKRS